MSAADVPCYRTPLARALIAGADVVFDDWEQRARALLPGAGPAPRLVLRDYLLGFLHNVAAALDAVAAGEPLPEQPYLADADIHGRLRASIPDYDVAQVITEYRLLRQAVLNRVQALDPTVEQRDAIMAVTEAHITAAASAFSVSTRELQEHVAQAISHDLRTPLGTLRMTLQLALRQGGTDPRLLERALQVASRLDRITEGALNVAALQAGQGLRADFGQVDLAEVVRQVYETATQMTPELEFRLQLPDGSLVGRFSHSACERAMENLVDNAIKYGDRARPISLSLRREGEEAWLEVHNHGAPMPAEEQARVLRAFVRGGHERHASQRGWGLGLSMVNAVAQAHGGQLEIRSEEGWGTLFRIRLPVAGTAEDTVLLTPYSS